MAVTSEGNVVVTSTMINGQSLGSFVAMSSPKLPNTPTWKVDIKSGTYTSLLNADQTSVSYQYTENTLNGVQQLVVDKTGKDNAVYNLQGMKLRAPQKGLNIIGGKKVVIK